jgi:protein-tyrosine kinase
MSLIERAIDKLSGGDPQDRLSVPSPNTKSQTSATTIPTVPVAPSASAIDAAVARHNAQLGNSEITRDTSPSVRSNVNREAVRIHLEGMRLKGLLTPDVKQTATAEEFRVIKRPLLANAFGRGTAPVKNGKRIMVTSAFPGEGKSFCAINLAMSIAAERDNRVLLIDADVARPSIPRELGISAEVGLMDWLIDGKLDISDLVLDTNVDKLTILPAGRRHQQATELLASGSMSRLLEQISSRFPDRVCIFDSPPLLVTTEARVLASYMGQIVMVVEAGRTPRDQVTDALQTIAACDVVGLVLNKAKKIETNGYYGYGYGAG